jgi:hypothetical protein
MESKSFNLGRYRLKDALRRRENVFGVFRGLMANIHTKDGREIFDGAVSCMMDYLQTAAELGATVSSREDWADRGCKSLAVPELRTGAVVKFLCAGVSSGGISRRGSNQQTNYS